MQRRFFHWVLPALLAMLCMASAHAGKVALLLEEPYGHFGAMNPTGHAAIYLSDVCADTPTHLRRCDPGETGVVLSRYHKVDGYDWLAIPLLPYLYAVNNAQNIPAEVDPETVARMQNEYRRANLLDYVPDDPAHAIPGGDWTQLVGEAYIRKIYGYALETRPEQDDMLIAALNNHVNRTHFNLFFSNCANFAEMILNFYYPHSIHRNFISDVGLMTPKQTARSMEKYAKHHRDLQFTTFVIPQIPGTIHRSTPVHGVIESLIETKKYVLPLAVLHPAVAGGLVAVYIGDGRFHPGSPTEAVFNPRLQSEPGATQAETTVSTGSETIKGAAGVGSLRTVTFQP